MTFTSASEPTNIEWSELQALRRAGWRTDLHGPPPKRVIIADDTWSADQAYRSITQGTALLWRGDFQNARQLLQALARRIDKKKSSAVQTDLDITARFHRHRLQQSQRSQLLNQILVELQDDASIALRRAPDVKLACLAAMGKNDGAQLIPLRMLQGYVGAYEWQKKGVEVPGLPERIHVPHGVYSPLRGEYLQLIQSAPLPSNHRRGFDIGTGSGVLAAIMALRGVSEVIATDINERALACAADNLDRMGLSDQVALVHANLFPQGKADLIVCNPPWLPVKPTSRIELALYDPEHAMLRAYLDGVCRHLEPQGEAWLIMSNLAEALGLRPPRQLQELFHKAGLRVIDKLDTRPVHAKAQDNADPLHEARSVEITSLWRLECNQAP
jgi:methylase of polypeptide subunit release factors